MCVSGFMTDSFAISSVSTFFSTKCIILLFTEIDHYVKCQNRCLNILNGFVYLCKLRVCNVVLSGIERTENYIDKLTNNVSLKFGVINY